MIFRCRLGLHRWEHARVLGVHIYERCPDCGKRRALRHLAHGYSPLDTSWLETGVWTDSLHLVPPPGARSAVWTPRGHR